MRGSDVIHLAARRMRKLSDLRGALALAHIAARHPARLSPRLC